MKLTHAIASLLLLSFCAAAPSISTAASKASHEDCIFAGTISDWRPLDEQNLILFAAGRRPYHVVLARRAFGLSYESQIAIYDRDGRICSYGGDSIIVDGVMTDRIFISSIRKLSDSELEQVYVDFGIHKPIVVEATGTELEETEN